MLTISDFRSLFDQHFDAIRRFIFYRCGNVEASSDLAQDVFMTIWEKRGRFNGEANLVSLLYKISNDMVITKYRKEQSRQEYEKYLSLSEEKTSSAEEELQYKELRLLYAELLEQMPEKQRVVFLFNRNEGMTYPAIAERLNISVKAVEKRMSAALKLFRTNLKS